MAVAEDRIYWHASVKRAGQMLLTDKCPCLEHWWEVSRLNDSQADRTAGVRILTTRNNTKTGILLAETLGMCGGSYT